MPAAPSVVELGRSRSPLLVIDEASGAIEGIRSLAASLGPFPPMRGNAYPGLRRYIAPGDAAAADYARRMLGLVVAPIREIFGFEGFDLLDASFSMVTTRPDALRPEQRAPHFDSVDPAYLAVMHYIGGAEGGGTGFYRQRSTGIERVDARNLSTFVSAARGEAAGWRGYVGEGNGSFDRIGQVAGRPDRLVVYPGCLLHSGLIPADMAFSDDPRTGRLTANFFVRGRAGAG